MVIIIERLLKDIVEKSIQQNIDIPTQRIFIETILDNIFQFFYKNGQPIHTVAIGILRGNTFDMYYKGRLIEKFTEMFGAMSYDTTIAGRACELFKKEGKQYLHLFSKTKIIEEFQIASEQLKELGFSEESEDLRKRALATIDQGVGSFLLIPISFAGYIIGIFTISSIIESDEKHILGENIGEKFIPIVQMLSLILFMEKISYDKTEEMGRLLISSIDGKDEYQATHSLDVRTMIDMFIDELSRDKQLRQRIEDIGFKLTVDKIERLRMAALLHDIGKIFVPSKILRKYDLNRDELLIRKMHSYCTYNMLINSITLKDIADIASMHHARYFIPADLYQTNLIGYPFDRVMKDTYTPESQIIALADTFNSMIRSRPDRKGLDISQALELIEKDEFKFHGGFKDIFLTIVRRVEKNITMKKYSPKQISDYQTCLWLENEEEENTTNYEFYDLQELLKKITYNNLGIISLMEQNDVLTALEGNIKIHDELVQMFKIEDKYVILVIINIPKEVGFKWIFNILDYLKTLNFKKKVSFAFIGNRGHKRDIQNIYESLRDGLNIIKNEPAHYFLIPEMYKCK